MILRDFLPYLLLLPAIALAEDRYRATFSEDLSSVSVEACFDGPAPDYLYRHEAAAAYSSTLKWNTQEIKAPSRSWRVELPELPRDTCLQWHVDLAAAAASSKYQLAMKFDSGYVTSGNLWFWRDGDHRPVSVHVELPSGQSLSTPWRPVNSSGKHLVYEPQITPVSWSSRIAVGKFRTTEVVLPESRLRVATIGTSAEQDTKLLRWVKEATDSVSQVTGKFPRADLQILIIAIGARDGPVPWAHVLRGSGVAIEFFVDETRPLEEFVEDWKATHEFSHLFLPYVTSKDRWLSEGLATYYENVLRSRQGILTEEQAWQRLDRGFERGREATRGETLARATRSGRAATMRIYWSGAAMMLKADTKIRTLSEGKFSLDDTLASLQGCCLAQDRTWTARELFDQMDQLGGYEVFSSLYRDHVHSEEFPDVSEVYEQLGLEIGPDRVSMIDQARGSQIRTQIMNPGSAVKKAESLNPFPGRK
jgi:predicted metalloprotease with PDZ domain